MFPDDLIAAIEQKDDWALSCSVIWPGHNMSPVGSVGVIFEPSSLDQVLSVCNTDSGSSALANGEDGSLGHPLSPETFAETFSVMDGDYNEWRLRGAKVKGIFVVDRTDIRTKKELSVPVPPGMEPITIITTVQTSFDQIDLLASSLSLPTYTMGVDGPELV